MTKFALGTVQLGLPYGVGVSSMPSLEDALEILSCAYRQGIDTLDTAHSYGLAEERVGLSPHPFKIITKIPSGADAVSPYFKLSHQRLKKNIYGLLLHQETDLIRLYPELKQQPVEKIGVSSYDPEYLLKLLRTYDINLVQVPFNILDDRFFSDELIRIYEEKQIEVHIRSVYLKGAFFLEKKTNSFLDEIIKLKKKLQNITNIPLSDLSLNYAMQHPRIQKILIGINSVSELSSLIDNKNFSINIPSPEKIQSLLPKKSISRLRDPRLWTN